jgi:hypothetical protein
MCVDVCYPNEGVTCGVYGQDVSLYFVITPMLQMNLSDSDFVQIQGLNVTSFYFLFGFPVTSFQFGNFVPIRPERTCGVVVNNTTVRDSGQYVCTLTHSALNTLSVTLKQTLHLCSR